VKRAAAFHDEVLVALQAIGNPARGAAVQQDRGSQLLHLGIGFPALRARVKAGFSFSALPPEQVLEIWDGLWRSSPCADVLFAAIEYLAPVVRKAPPPHIWPVVQHWHERVDNWCHSDALSGIYSRLLAAQFDAVYPRLQSWNSAQDQWQRRLSITSLIRYSGKNAVFLRPEPMLPLLANCVADHRKYVELALGWVLRELGHVHRDAADAFLHEHGAAMSARAVGRAIEARSPPEQARLKKRR
jgi:3-methyladenine DNA glycosylase AlkD